MPKRFFLASFCLMLGLWMAPRPASAQLVPHAPQVDLNKMEQQGLGLLQEAAQLAQFEQIPLAIARARLSTQLAPKSAEAWAVLGSLYLHPSTNQAKDAIAALKRAQSLDPRNAAIHFALGNAYFQEQQYTESVTAPQTKQSAAKSPATTETRAAAIAQPSDVNSLQPQLSLSKKNHPAVSCPTPKLATHSHTSSQIEKSWKILDPPGKSSVVVPIP